MDGFRDICRHIKRYAACDSLRKIIRNFLHFGFHFFCHIDGILSREHEYVEHGGRAAVNAAFGGIA